MCTMCKVFYPKSEWLNIGNLVSFEGNATTSKVITLK